MPGALPALRRRAAGRSRSEHLSSPRCVTESPPTGRRGGSGATSRTTSFRTSQTKDERNAGEHLLEARNLSGKVLPAGWRDAIEPHTSVRCRDAPLGREQFPLQEPLQRWIERTLLDLQHVVGDLPDALNQRVAVERLVLNEA